jgi:hypothetical protein
MPGERRAHGDVGGLSVADFADHQDIRILSQEGAQRARISGGPRAGVGAYAGYGGKVTATAATPQLGCTQ